MTPKLSYPVNIDYSISYYNYYEFGHELLWFWLNSPKHLPGRNLGDGQAEWFKLGVF